MSFAGPEGLWCCADAEWETFARKDCHQPCCALHRNQRLLQRPVRSPLGCGTVANGQNHLSFPGNMSSQVRGIKILSPVFWFARMLTDNESIREIWWLCKISWFEVRNEWMATCPSQNSFSIGMALYCPCSLFIIRISSRSTCLQLSFLSLFAIMILYAFDS